MNKNAKIRRLFVLQHSTETKNYLIDQMMAVYRGLAPEIDETDWTVLVERLKVAMSEEISVTAYAAVFSEEEIDAMLAYAESDVGQKMVRVLPGIMIATRAAYDRVVKLEFSKFMEEQLAKVDSDEGDQVNSWMS